MTGKSGRPRTVIVCPSSFANCSLTLAFCESRVDGAVRGCRGVERQQQTMTQLREK